MPRRSRRTISDDIHCINNARIDASSKNVFFIRLSILFLCFWPIIMANADDTATTNSTNFLSILGLPRKNHCALYYNNALFILKGQPPSSSSVSPSLAITFTNDSFLASSEQFPSIQWIENNNDSNSQQQQQPSTSICTVTSYGQAILFHPNTLQNNDTIDLNTMNWTSTSSSSLSSPLLENVTTMAATIMKDDTILVLGKNNNNDNNNNNNNSAFLSTWILDASDDQLQWTWTQLTSSSPSLLMDESTLISASMTTTTSYILYFGVSTTTATTPITTATTDNIYSVSVYCFDISSLTWMGSLLNFTSTANHIQSVMISSNNNNKNDTLLIVPDWIDTTIIHATSDINVTKNAAEKNQQIQQEWRWYQQQQQQQQQQQDGFWVLTIDASPPPSSSSSLPSVDLAWQQSSSNLNTIHGGSVTLVGNETVVFYGGESVVTRGTPSLSSRSTSTDSNSSMNFQLRFWNIADRSFLATPAWLAPFLPSSSAPPTPSSTSNGADNTNDTAGGDNDSKLIIILGTFLGFFGLAFLCLLGLLLWRRKKRQHEEKNNAGGGTTGQLEHGESASSHRHITPRIDQQDNAATWAEQLHRSFSTMLQRLRPSSSSPTRRKSATVAGLAISAPLVASAAAHLHQQQQQQQQEEEDKDGMQQQQGEDKEGMQQQQQQQQQEQDNDDTLHTVPTPSPPPPPPPPPPLAPPVSSLPMSSSSNLTTSAPQSTRNSWLEGSLKASRFVEHF